MAERLVIGRSLTTFMGGIDMENEDVAVDDGNIQETEEPLPGDRQRKLAAWMQFPRRIVLLLVAFGFAHALIAVLRMPIAAASVDPLMPPEAQAQVEEAIRQGELISIETGEPVSELLARYLPNTLALVGAALALALILAALASLVAILVHQLEERSGPIGSILKGLGRLLAFGPAAPPIFCLALALIFLLAVRLRWLPAVGMFEPGGPDDLGARLQHLVLPALTLAAFPATVTAQAVSRELTRPDKAEGKRLLLAGVFRALGNLLGQVGGVLSAAVLVEVMFAWPGIGRLLTTFVMRRDYPVLLGTLAAYPALILVGRLLAELFRWLARLVEGPVPEQQSQGELAPSRWRRTARIIWTVAGLALLLIPLVVAAAGLVVNEDAVMVPDVDSRLQPPSIEHPLGTDPIGRDVFARILRGGSMELGTAALAAGILFLPGLVCGALLGFLFSRRTWWAESIADVLLLPADILLYIPIIPSGIVLWLLLLGGGPQQGAMVALALIVAVALLPRVVRLSPPLWEAAPERQKWLRIALAGSGAVLLGSLFAGLWMVAAMDFLGMGFVPPTPSLGGESQYLIQYLREISPWPVIAVLWACAFALYTAADALVGFFWTKEALAHLNE
jgi:ABC-type dipeptide/oligopeptide/nickel transport system permease component/ABC-type dipeptide/oligopeptide/nickel transport system permease subunit